MKKAVVLAVCACLVAAATAHTCSPEPSSNCGVVVQTGLSSEDKAELLRAHNEFRSRVAQGLETRGASGAQPAAANMRLMEWDDELAELAQGLANECVFQHNSCGGSTRVSVGQNLYALIAGKLMKVNMTKAAESWYNEVDKFTSSSIKPFAFTSNTGHYTQLVWADSYMLGCGMIGYPYSDSKKVWHTVVCNYGPAGNMLQGTMYLTGPACSKCGAGLACNQSYKGLCG